MTSRIGKIAPLVIAALCFARCVLGQAPPSGTYSNSFSDLLSVWDVSGAYDEDVLGGDLVGNCTISQDAQGKITGTGSASYSNSDYGITVDMDFTVNGSVKSANGVTTVLWNQKFKGSGTYGSDPFKFNGSIKLNASIDQTNQTLSGNISGNVCGNYQGLSTCASLEELNGGPIEFEVPIADPLMDGSWDLMMAVTKVNDKSLVVTNATLTLSNGRTIVLSGKGAYRANTNQTKLSLKGDPKSASKGASLQLIANGASMEIAALTGKLLGQKPTLKP